MQIMLSCDMLPNKVKDLAGQQFGYLVAQEFVGLRTRGRSSTRRAYWRCECRCGATVERPSVDLIHGNTKSCGCGKAEMIRERVTRHGHSAGGPASKTYTVWVGMKGRCSRAKNNRYAQYGGRGISVCERWQTFANFLADMGERPDGYSLERLDVNGNYEPSNCAWIPLRLQGRNTTRSAHVSLNGERMTQAEAAERLGVDQRTISKWVAVQKVLAAKGAELQALTAA